MGFRYESRHDILDEAGRGSRRMEYESKHDVLDEDGTKGSWWAPDISSMDWLIFIRVSQLVI